jgi:hypothetical protein
MKSYRLKKSEWNRYYEIRQAQKDKYHMFWLFVEAQNFDLTEEESRIVVTRGYEGGGQREIGQ